ncbi:MAG: hypothetical protein H0V86_01825 [Chloroflexia bacterium]|nr:hypothetical protein [Chloroflexia bacterium]
MQRYGSSGGYRGPRRSHPVRNTLIGVLTLLIVGALLASTDAGAHILDRIGLPSLRGENALVIDGTSTAGRPVVAGDSGDPTQSPTEPSTLEATAPSTDDKGKERSTAVVTPEPGKTTKVPTRSRPAPTPAPTAPPLEVARAYLQNWQAGRYDLMYRLIAESSEPRYTRKQFQERYEAIYAMATIKSVAPKLAPEAIQEAKRDELLLRLPYTVKMTTSVVGDITETNLLSLVKEQNTWRVQWSPSMIFKDLSGDNLIRRADYPATRGGIFDRNGKPLAIEGPIPQIGVVPGEIANEREMLDKLSEGLGLDRKYIQQQYKGREPTYFWPIRDLLPERAKQLQSQLGKLAGVRFSERLGRVYPQGPVMAQVLGYVTGVFAEDLEKPAYANYTASDVIGRAGLEAWGEPHLRGEPGGKVFIVDPDGVEIKTIKEKPYRPGNNIYLTIDLELQRKAEQDLASVKLRKGPVAGSVVALDPANGKILTLASLPTFDPNKFVIGFPADEYARLTSKAGKNPFQNRATGSSFPPASTFKPITVAAALTAKLPKLNRTWYSTGTWDRLGDPVRRDWKEGGHGYVKLIDGITESIDTIFYDLGFELYLRDQDYLTEHAKKWHLGKSFNVEGLVDEASGQVPGPGVPYPYWAHGDNVNLAIGQGSMRASPLQMATVYATIGNGGTLYQPLLIDRIVSAENSNQIIKQYKPAAIGKAPVDKRTLEFLQQGLRTVTNADKGTATYVFRDSAISVAGKTGTGQQDRKDPFAWFIGYAPATSPRIVVAVEAEDAGEGSEIAAPVARKVLESYLKPPAARP